MGKRDREERERGGIVIRERKEERGREGREKSGIWRRGRRGRERLGVVN